MSSQTASHEICRGTDIPMIYTDQVLTKMVKRHLIGSCNGTFFALHALLKLHEPTIIINNPVRRTDKS